MVSSIENRVCSCSILLLFNLFFNLTRMHSSRMRTGRSLTVCCSVLPGGGSPWSGGGWGGVPGPGGVLLGPGGVSLVPGGGVCLVWGGSAWSRGGVLRRTPPPLTESQTRVKT